MKAISEGSLAGCLVHLDAGSTDRLAQQDLQIPEHADKRTLPSWLLMLVYLPEIDPPQVARITIRSLPYLLKIKIANHSSFAPGATPKTTQQRCALSSRAQFQQEDDTPH